MNRDRRILLQAGLLLPLLAGGGSAAAAEAGRDGDIRIILPRSNPIRLPKDFDRRLARATLEYLESQFRGKNLPVWRRPFESVDLEPRLASIARCIVAAVEEHRASYYVDPVWVIAQMMAESYFYEYAISSSLALGICQFIQPTALEYGLRCAGEAPAHAAAPYAQPEAAGDGRRFYALRDEKRRYKEERQAQLLELETLVAALAAGEIEPWRTKAQQHLALRQALEAYDARIDEARASFRGYLEANVQGRSLFDPQDLAFISGFDERFTHQKPISAMVKMLAWALDNRNGNILAAAAGYNAGLGRTKDDGFFGDYGRIPAIEQTTLYLSHIVVNHHEIGRRLGSVG